MTGKVLVVDDILSNVKLLEAKLTAEYFDVAAAFDGPQCLAYLEQQLPDLILLDVMMPGMDGFEVCRRIKSNSRTAHLPVVMITALDQPSDRVAGLEAGADDFLTKPVDDTALFARVRSLMRLKMMTDELRTRGFIGQGMDSIDQNETLTEGTQSGRILIIEDRHESIAWFASALTPTHEVSSADTFEEALVRVKAGDYDLIVVSLGLRNFDGLRLCSQLRSLPEGRHTPILVVVSDGDRYKLTQALEMGVNDYLTRPVDKNELVARVRTQMRKKRYVDALRDNFEKIFVRLAQRAIPNDVPPVAPVKATKINSDQWDVFISHASEDKVEVVRPLCNLLRAHGIKVWLDENELKIGDSLRRKIEQGLANSLFGVVILSEAFFSKNWPKRELDSLISLETDQRKIILPVRHKLGHEKVAEYSPLLADKYASTTDNGLDVVAQQISAAVADSRGGFA